VNRYAVLYLATMIVLLPLDFLFLGVLAKGLFVSEVGDMLGEVRVTPAILFYLIYIAGIVVFVNGTAAAAWQSTALYGALFGLFCYATFELTSMAMLRHWSWAVVAVDMSWGMAITAISATAGLLITNWLVPKV
jgi:uncharacterized membrane protein